MILKYRAGSLWEFLLSLRDPKSNINDKDHSRQSQTPAEREESLTLLQ